MAVRVPRSVKAATVLLERFAALDGQVAAIEVKRREELAAVNARFDLQAGQLLGEHGELLGAIKAWWARDGAGLLDGKRKSISLGGCEVGSRSAPASLGIAGDVDVVTAALAKRTWAGELVRTSVSLDRNAILKSIDGAHAKQLAALGFSKVSGAETIFVRRVAQGGTLGAAAAS